MLCQYFDNNTDILCENNEQKPVGLALLSSRSDNWVDVNMTRVNDLTKRLDKELFTSSETCFWKKRKIIPT